MEVKSIEKKEQSTAAVTVVVSKDEFEKAVNAVYVKSRKSINVPGFRKGKAPRKIIENIYGTDIFYDDAINDIAPDAYKFMVEDKDLKIAALPYVESADLNDDKDLEIVFIAALYPEVLVKKYKGLEAVRRVVVVDPAEVDIELDALRKRNSSLITSEDEAKFGDIVIIDYEGFKEGIPFDGGKAEEHSLEIGSNSFIPGFEAQCVGLKAGDEKDIELTFPENYSAEELAGQPVVFKIKCREVKNRLMPELDDEFAKDVSEFDTLEEYRISIHDKINKQKSEAVQNDFMDALMEQLIENTETDPPESMINERAERLVSEYSSRIKAQGIDLDTYLQIFGIDRSVFDANTRNTAEKQIRTELALKKVAELENLELTEEDKDKEYEKVAESYGVDVETVKTFFDPEVFNESCLFSKAAEFVADNAIALPEPEETEAEETKTKGTEADEPEINSEDKSDASGETE